jgi:DNA-binding HxlR family transcriptional regulator
LPAYPSGRGAGQFPQRLEYRDCADGLVEKRRYQDNPPRYEYHLTQAGKGRLPVVRALAKWSSQFVDGVSIPETQA